jgi:hypothetical protein
MTIEVGAIEVDLIFVTTVMKLVIYQEIVLIRIEGNNSTDLVDPEMKIEIPERGKKQEDGIKVVNLQDLLLLTGEELRPSRVRMFLNHLVVGAEMTKLLRINILNHLMPLGVKNSSLVAGEARLLRELMSNPHGEKMLVTTMKPGAMLQ